MDLEIEARAGERLQRDSVPSPFPYTEHMRVVALEGGYDFEALSKSTGATLAALIGQPFRPEEASTGEVGVPTLVAARQHWEF